MRIIRAKTSRQRARAAAQGAEALESGLLVAFPTETVYGVAALATNPQALARLRELKSRPIRPFSVHLGRPDDASRYVGRMQAEAQRLIRRAWPGPLTILTTAGGRLADPDLRKAGLYGVLCADDLIALRCPDEPAARAMLGAVQMPVVATSANRARAKSPTSAGQVASAMADEIDLLIDAGPTRYGADSTIVRCDESGWRIVRRGVWDTKTIRKFLLRRLLFVCTGNTCRSPMAVGLARKLLARQMDCRVSQLASRGIEVVSAGIATAGGAKPAPEAVAAARRLGADISAHRSQEITAELINAADMIFCMTEFHADEVRRIGPAAAERVRLLDPDGEISDPIGGGPEVYGRTAERIEKSLKRVLKEGLP